MPFSPKKIKLIYENTPIHIQFNATRDPRNERKMIVQRIVEVGAQNIVETPPHVIFLLDISGSMSGKLPLEHASGDAALTRMDAAKHYIASMLRHLPNETLLSLCFFDNTPKTVIERIRKDERNEHFLNRLATATPTGGTETDPAMKAAGLLSRQTQEACVSDTRIILITDGEPNGLNADDHKAMFESFQKEASGTAPGLITIGIGDRAGRPFCEYMSRRAHGPCILLQGDGNITQGAFLEQVGSVAYETSRRCRSALHFSTTALDFLGTGYPQIGEPTALGCIYFGEKHVFSPEVIDVSQLPEQLFFKVERVGEHQAECTVARADLWNESGFEETLPIEFAEFQLTDLKRRILFGSSNQSLILSNLRNDWGKDGVLFDSERKTKLLQALDIAISEENQKTPAPRKKQIQSTLSVGSSGEETLYFKDMSGNQYTIKCESPISYGDLKQLLLDEASTKGVDVSGKEPCLTVMGPVGDDELVHITEMKRFSTLYVGFRDAPPKKQPAQKKAIVPPKASDKPAEPDEPDESTAYYQFASSEASVSTLKIEPKWNDTVTTVTKEIVDALNIQSQHAMCVVIHYKGKQLPASTRMCSILGQDATAIFAVRVKSLVNDISVKVHVDLSALKSSLKKLNFTFAANRSVAELFEEIKQQRSQLAAAAFKSELYQLTYQGSPLVESEMLGVAIQFSPTVNITLQLKPSLSAVHDSTHESALVPRVQVNPERHIVVTGLDETTTLILQPWVILQTLLTTLQRRDVDANFVLQVFGSSRCLNLTGTLEQNRMGDGACVALVSREETHPCVSDLQRFALMLHNLAKEVDFTPAPPAQARATSLTASGYSTFESSLAQLVSDALFKNPQLPEDYKQDKSKLCSLLEACFRVLNQDISTLSLREKRQYCKKIMTAFDLDTGDFMSKIQKAISGVMQPLTKEGLHHAS
ncbi:MAG: VWA domain-containing protein [Gammaproteobacteria bacterium]|nr:VWA domain-containing protein [Gammaproteobacteria bacterium]